MQSNEPQQQLEVVPHEAGPVYAFGTIGKI